MIRVQVPAHLRTLAKVQGEIEVHVAAPVTIRRVLDAVETRYPALGGTIRDYETKERRAFVRFFVCMEDWSNELIDRELPGDVVSGKEPFMVVGALAGG